MDGFMFDVNAAASFDQVAQSGPASAPLSFDTPTIGRAERVDAAVYNPSTHGILPVSNIVYERYPDGRHPSRAFWVGRKVHSCIFGVIRYCTILNFRHDIDVPWEVTEHRSVVKILSWDKIRNIRHVESPEKETAAMQHLARNGAHPNVMYPFEVLQDEDYLFIFMPFCDSGELFSFVQSSGRFPEPMSRYWFRQILAGVEHMQRNGVCHRDMSLENVMVDRLKTSIIIDMGMCLRIPYVTADGNGITDVSSGTMRLLIRPDTPCGKPYYISPEILQSRQPFDGFSIDLWAAGVMLFIMLTGMPPWQVASDDDPHFRMISQGGLERVLRSFERPVSVAAMDLLQRMLLADPRQRLTLSEIKDHPWYQEEVPEVALQDPTPMEGWRY